MITMYCHVFTNHSVLTSSFFPYVEGKQSATYVAIDDSARFVPATYLLTLSRKDRCFRLSRVRDPVCVSCATCLWLLLNSGVVSRGRTYALRQDALVTLGRAAVLHGDRTPRWTHVSETAMAVGSDRQVGLFRRDTADEHDL